MTTKWSPLAARMRHLADTRIQYERQGGMKCAALARAKSHTESTDRILKGYLPEAILLHRRGMGQGIDKWLNPIRASNSAGDRAKGIDRAVAETIA